MSFTGPQLPPHLRKPPPHSRSRSPSPTHPAESETAGPSLPPHLRHRASPANGPQEKSENKTEEDGDAEEDEDETAGPALPPHLLAKRKAQQPSSSSSRAVAGPSRPTLGPTPASTSPAYASTSNPSRRAYDEDDDDEDEDVGPSLSLAAGASGGGVDAEREFREREERLRKMREEDAKPKEMKREEWMLNPPEAGNMFSNMDPTKLRARGFAQSSEEVVKKKDMTLWTETPAEKQQRLADELSGKKRKATAGPSLDDGEEVELARKRRRDLEIDEQIRAHNEKHRSASLLNQHSQSSSSSGKKEKDDAPAIWDRDSMMGVSGKMMGERDRAALVKDAKGLNSRFGHSKGGAYS